MILETFKNRIFELHGMGIFTYMAVWPLASGIRFAKFGETLLS